jgi:integrase
LAKDKSVAQKMLADKVASAERGVAQMPDKNEASQSLESLLEEFGAHLARRSGQQHKDMVMLDVRRVLMACRLTTLGQLRDRDLSTKVEAYVWSRMKGEKPVGAATAAYTGKHARSFTRWLWGKRKLLEFDPLAGMDLPSQETGKPRRALSPDELVRLNESTEGSPREYRGLSGKDRALLYLLATSTGLRAGELAKLTPACFDLEADYPVVRLSGKATKNKKAAEQPLPPLVVARLRTHLAGKPKDHPIWPGTWSERSADMFKLDMAEAGLPLTVNGETALFHSFRHSYTSLLSRSATVKVTQELARHSTPLLTIGRYSHTSLAEKASAVAALPLPGSHNLIGPFSKLPRAELESLTEAILIGLLASLFTPRLTPLSGTMLDGAERTGTKTADPDQKPD